MLNPMAAITAEFHREYLLRLPLPLAQLYSRAFNAKDARARHDNTFYLFEALIKLTAVPLIADYLWEIEQGAARVASLDHLLAQLALPSLGQWVAMLRELARHFGQRPDASAHPLGHLWNQLSAKRRDCPAILALYRRIKKGPDGEAADDQTCSLQYLFDALVQYRNGVFGHGAGRFQEFYECEMGPLLLPAANELLAEGVLDLLGSRGSRLVCLAELRVLDENRIEVGLMELIGRESERMAPLQLTTAESSGLAPNCVAVLWPGRRVPLRVDPLLVFRGTELTEEVLFLNRDRNGRHAEYLSYTTGRTERDQSMGPALAGLLTHITGREIEESDLERLGAQSLAGTSKIEDLFAPAEPRPITLGDYEILAEVGRGGMGVVYLARQMSLGRLVALKMLPAELSADEVALARFRREMRALGRCEHPYIVKVLSNGMLPDGRQYYTMEFVPGADLELVWRELVNPSRPTDTGSLGSTTWTRAVLSASRKRREHTTHRAEGVSSARAEPRAISDQIPPNSNQPQDAVSAAPSDPPAVAQLPLPPLPELPVVADDPGGYCRRVASLARDAAKALAAVHEQGIVHRDVKPANLMLTPDGLRVVLMDFGLAKGQNLTVSVGQSGGLLGTLRYAAPEQLAAASLQVGPPADIRGLGVTLWELLTRQRLFGEAEDEKQLAALIHDVDVPRLRSIDPTLDADLEAIVARATERRVVDRIQSAGQLAEYLQMYLDGELLPIRPPGLLEIMGRRIRKHAPLIATTAVAVLLLAALTAGLLSRHRQEVRYNHAMALVETIRDAELPQAIGLIEQLTPEREWVNPRLQELAADPNLEPRQRLRVELALLPVEPERARTVSEVLLQALPQDALLLRNQLLPHAPRVVDSFWTVVETHSDERSPAVLRAACALAVLDRDSSRWAAAAPRIADELVHDNPIFLKLWADGLRPVKPRLIGPLAAICRNADSGAAERSLATSIVADYAEDAEHLKLLTDLLLGGTDDQFSSLFPRISQRPQSAVDLLAAELRRPQHSDVPAAEKELLAKRQAKAAALMALLGRAEFAWPLLRYQPMESDPLSLDPRRRSYLIEQFRRFGVPPDELAAQWFVERDALIRRALLLSLGEYSPQKLKPETLRGLTAELNLALQTEPSAGLRSAAEWLLRHWDLAAENGSHDAEPRNPEPAAKPVGNREWYVNREGITMVILRGPIEFRMGSPPEEEQRIAEIENQHRVRIPRTFAVATKHVTQAQFHRFRADYPDENLKVYAPHADCPAISVNWYMAAAYCNWLSERDGIEPQQWCYPPAQPFADGMPMNKDYLHRTGYRLLSEAEWEYACRAHATTSRFCGDSEELLVHYAWYAENSRDSWTLPVGSLKPNDFGLFDMQGNADEWCQERRRSYPLIAPSQAVEDVEDTAVVHDSEERVLRGGSYGARPAFVRSANRFQARPDTVRRYYSFRVARTMPE
jgi:formylglycine-generating enzyme required for sulfatase activity/serine/threonine protein kinase